MLCQELQEETRFNLTRDTEVMFLHSLVYHTSGPVGEIIEDNALNLGDGMGSLDAEMNRGGTSEETWG